MGIKSRGNFSTNMDKCMPKCRCLLCARKKKEKAKKPSPKS